MRSSAARRSRGALAPALALAAALASGCPLESQPTPADAGPKPSPCKVGFVGDESLEPEMQIVALGADGVSIPIDDGGTVPLILPPQGGRVVFAGVHARNVNACGAKLTGVLRDPVTQKIVIDARTVNLKLTASGDVGTTDTDTSTFANIPVCPNQWSTTDAFSGQYALEMSLKDRDDRVVKKTIIVTLECAEPDNEEQCLCICKQGYVLGEMCEPDGGTPP